MVSKKMSAPPKWGAIMLAVLNLGVLAGCSVSGASPSPNASSGLTLQGQVFAGRNYMAGAAVSVYETQPTGVATNGTYVGTAKLLGSATAGTTGEWSATGLSCESPNQVYVTASGGTPYPSGLNSTTLPENPDSLMLTAIGDCSILGGASSSASDVTVITNEASTVAAVWSLRNFISLDGTTVNITSSATNYAGNDGVGGPGNYAGLVHAFENANNLSPYTVGNFSQYTNQASSATGGGQIPVEELNSLAYVQYLCTIGTASSSDSSLSYCASLFQLATPPGGTAPANSLQAMLNIASHPANNAAAILQFSLTPIPYSGQTEPQVINAGVYVPALNSLGTLTGDWSVAIYYLPGYGATTTAQGSEYLPAVTIDANDSAYFTNWEASSGSTGGNVVAMASNGANLWNSTTNTSYVEPEGIAADANGNLWVVNSSGTAADSVVEQINAASGALVKTYTAPAVDLYGIAADSLGNVWYTANSTSAQNLNELVLSNGIYSPASFSVTPQSTTYDFLQVTPDSYNNIWVAGYNTSSAATFVLPNAGGSAATPAYTKGLISAGLSGDEAYGIAVDAANNGYSAPVGKSLYKINMTGTGAAATLSAAAAATNSAAAPRYLETDGAGSIWYPDATTGTKLYQYLPSSGTVNAYYPCYLGVTTGDTSNTTTTAGTVTCSTGISTRREFAIDSTGSIWVASYGNSGGARMVQILGLAAPTVPLKAMGKAGVMP